MKKPIVNQPERNCPECMGTGFTMANHPTRPSVKIYQQCKECEGKGRVAALLRRPHRGNIR
jgi:DnaJ-class molecular chaperone